MESAGKKRSKDSKGGRSKRKRKLSQSDEDGPAFLSSKYAEPPISKIYNSRFRTQAPAELFRKDLISAMKLPDSEPLTPDDYWLIDDPWRPEWEKGVQVPVEPDALPEPNFIEFRKRRNCNFKLPKKLIHLAKDKRFSPDIHYLSFTTALSEQVCRYDLDDVDLQWLHIVNEDRDDFGLEPIEESTVEKIIEEVEDLCFDNLQEALRNDATLNMEADEDAICDVCRSPDSEDGNEIVFCDACNICVHQSCYGITKIPEGSWICRTCALGVRPICLLCPNRGGAMKPTRTGEKWCHVSCAIWLPEVSIGCVERMEPITKLSSIPPFRWQLVCYICDKKGGACIQCSEKTCKVSYHVTCAFKAGLRMRAIMSDDEMDDALKLKSYCQKHMDGSYLLSDGESDEGNKKEFEMTSEEKHHTTREQILQEQEANFFNYATLEEVHSMFSYDQDVVDLVYNFWKLKRKANFNRPLLQPRQITVVDSSIEENCTYGLVKRMVMLRRDLERSRNLCYMVTKREKMVKNWIKIKQEIFEKQVEIISDSSLKLSKEELKAVYLANHGDLALDKVHTGSRGPSATTLKVLNSLIGEENTRVQLNGILKMSKKNQSTQLKKASVNPYAKHYLNGLLKRSQRWLTTVDRQKWEESYYMSEHSFDGQSDHNTSLSTTCDHVDTGSNAVGSSGCFESIGPGHKVDTVQDELCKEESSFQKDCIQNSCSDDQNCYLKTENETIDEIEENNSVVDCESTLKDFAVDVTSSTENAAEVERNDVKVPLSRSKLRKSFHRKSNRSNDCLVQKTSKKRSKNRFKRRVKSEKISSSHNDCSLVDSKDMLDDCHSKTPEKSSPLSSHVTENPLENEVSAAQEDGNNVEVLLEVEMSNLSGSESIHFENVDLTSLDNLKVIDETTSSTTSSKGVDCSLADVKENSFSGLVGLEAFGTDEYTDKESQDSDSQLEKLRDTHISWMDDSGAYGDLDNTGSLSSAEKCDSVKLSPLNIEDDGGKHTKSNLKGTVETSPFRGSSKLNSLPKKNDSSVSLRNPSLSHVNKHKKSPTSENEDRNKSDLVIEKKFVPKEEDSPLKMEVSSNNPPRKGSLTGYKIPKKVRSSIVEEAALERNGGNSPLSPLTDRTSSSTSTSSSYSTTNSYQTRRNNSPAVNFTRDVTEKVVNHSSHLQKKQPQPNPFVHSHTESHRLLSPVQKMSPPAAESYQWRAMYTGERVEVQDGHWRPLQYQRLPMRPFLPRYPNPAFRPWGPVHMPALRRPPHPFRSRPNPHT